MKIRRIVTSTGLLITGMFFGFFLAYVIAHRLRYAPPFRNWFDETCIYIPANEVVPTFTIFLIALASATACFVILFGRSVVFRRALFGLLIAAITFTIGIYLTAAM